MNKQSNYARTFCGHKTISLSYVLFMFITTFYFINSAAGAMSYTDKEAAMKRFEEYYLNIFNGAKLNEKEWWAERLRKDVYGVGLGGLEGHSQYMHRLAESHGGVVEIVFVSIEEKGDALEVKAYAVFKDKHTQDIGMPMDRENGLWKISNIGYEANRFAP